jgi:phosphopentomutase
VFVNLVETDMTYGHRNDPEGFHRCLQEIDRAIPDLLAALGPDDLLLLTSDHGCDPTTPSTDHSREYALLVAHVPGHGAAARHDGEFADVGASAATWLGVQGGDDLPGTPISL